MKDEVNFENYCFLIKFVEPKFVKDLLDGKFYFARNDYFIKLEENEVDIGIGDKHEGVWTMPLKENHTITLIAEDERIELPVASGVIRERNEDLKKIPICCFTFLSIKDDFLKVESGEKNTFTYQIKPEIEIKLREQFKGRNLIFFHNIDELINRFTKTAEKENMGMMYGKVKYYDEYEDHPLTREKFTINPEHTLMYKRNFFEYQKEWRLVIRAVMEKDCTMNIGDIRDIAHDMGFKDGNTDLGIELTFIAEDETSPMK